MTFMLLVGGEGGLKEIHFHSVTNSKLKKEMKKKKKKRFVINKQ